MPYKRHVALALLLTVLASACASPGRPPEPAPAPAPKSALPSPPPAAEPPPAPEPKAPEQTVSLFTLADLQKAKETPARTWTFTGDVAGFKLGPDGRTALLFPTIWEPSAGPALVDLPSGKQTPLRAAAKGSDYAGGGWLPDGRIYLVGNGKVWAGTPSDELKPLDGDGSAWSVFPSPSGRYLALWFPTPAGAITIVDLQQGAVRQVPGPFRRGAQDGAVSLGWSPDEKLLAGTDFDRDNGTGMKIRVVDPWAPAQVRTIPGALFVAWLPGGALLARRPAEGGDVPFRNVTVDAAGKETPFSAEFTGTITLSPDGRYLLYNAYKLNYGIVDLQTGLRFGMNFPGVPQWTAGNDLFTIRETIR